LLFFSIQLGDLLICFIYFDVQILNNPSMRTLLQSLLTIVSLLPLNYSYAQTGIDCANAESIIPSSNCNYSGHTTTGAEYWLTFVATNEHVNISLVTTKFGIDAPHIHSLSLVQGACGAQIEMGGDELPSADDAEELAIDLNTSDLIVGQTYYIIARRQATTHVCNKVSCTSNGSTNPTVFDLCIEDIDVVIPVDFNNEKPSSGFAMEVNRGQLIDGNGDFVPEIKMYNDRSNPATFIGDEKISYVFYGESNGNSASQRIDMDFVNGNKQSSVFKTEEVAGISNYYLPHIPEGVIGNRSYSRAVVNDIYSGIDIQYYSNIYGMKHYLVVEPNSNPDNIVIQFTGANSISIGTSGELLITSDLGVLEFEAPHIYQVAGVTPIEIVGGGYQMQGSDKIIFIIPPYLTSEPLIIQMDQGHSQPAAKNIDNLLWSTYYGGANTDNIEDVDHDAFGNVYFTGATEGLLFPQATQVIYPTTFDATRVIVGSHKSLGEKRWSTIYGGQQDYGLGIATDNLNNVYVTGFSGVFSEPNQFLDFPQVGAYNLAPLPVTSAVPYAALFKFDQITGTREWATLFGEHTAGSYFISQCIATDDLGNVYIAGEGERVSNHPVVATGSQHSETTTGNRVGFIAEFNVANALVWSTMFGNDDILIKEMNTVNNDLYIVGTATSTNTSMYATATDELNDYQAPFAGGATDAFFAKFNSSNEIKWSSFIGGAGDDRGNGIDYYAPNTSLYLTGQTNSNSTTFPLQQLTNPNVHNSNTVDGEDGFITVLKSTVETTGGHILHYSSYYGGDSDDHCGNIELSGTGNAYVIGMSKSLNNFPLQQLVGGYYQDELENDPTGIHFDSYIIGLNPSFELEWSTLYGGEWYYQGTDNVNAQSDDNGNGITVHNNDLIYIGGTTTSDLNFPITVDLVASPNAYIQYDNSGNPADVPDGWKDGFLAQFGTQGTVLALEEQDPNGVFGDLEIYPNPNNGSFVIASDNLMNSGTLRIDVTNVIGQVIFTKSINVNGSSISEEIKLANSSAGIYIINLSSGNNSVSKKIVVK
jgi:hypothetical protein